MFKQIRVPALYPQVYREGSVQMTKEMGSYENMNTRAINAERARDDANLQVDSLQHELKREKLKYDLDSIIKNLKIGTAKYNCNCPNSGKVWLYNTVMCPKYADGMANSADPDQTAPVGAV